MGEEIKTTELTEKEHKKNREDNLIPFKPGQSGNPKGRPKDTLEQKLIKKANQEIIEDYIGKLTEALPKISPTLIKKAQEGDIIAIKEVNDRVLGKSKASIDLTTGGKPFQVDPIEKAKADRALSDIEE